MLLLLRDTLNQKIIRVITKAVTAAADSKLEDCFLNIQYMYLSIKSDRNRCICYNR